MVLRKIEGMGVKVITKVDVSNVTTEKIVCSHTLLSFGDATKTTLKA